jgi:hypothetical protein
MQEVKTNLVVINHRLNKYILPALILFLLVATGLIYYSSAKAEVVSKTQISQTDLEEKYGLRLNLIGVTAGGGMVDLRLKIVDGEKARILLQDKNNFPVLQVNKSRVSLSASEDLKSQQIKFEDGVSLFLLYPNAGNAVKQGTPVMVNFGDIALRPIEVK